MESKASINICDRVCESFGSAGDVDAYQTAPLTLAYIGDTIYDLYVRTYFISTTKHTVARLHSLAVRMVCASAQAKAFSLINDMLTEKERCVFKRGKNTHSNVPKNADTADYRIATGFEALIGYLYLSGQDERLSELLSVIFSNIKEM